MTTQTKRDNKIKEILRYHGLSVLIKSEREFNHIKDFLGKDVLYLDFVPQMAIKPTAIVIWSSNKWYNTGQVGCAKSQKEDFIRIVEFKDFFK
jgi:glyoxylate carboligase